MILLALSLSIAENMSGQTPKVAIVNLDSLRSHSIIAEWEQVLRKDADWEQQGLDLIHSFLKKYHIRQQRDCSSPQAWEIMESEYQRDRDQIVAFERKIAAAKNLFSLEIEHFLIQQVFLLWLELKQDLNTTILSTSAPVFIEGTSKKDLIYLTDWLIQAFKNRPSVLSDWLSFRSRLMERVEKGKW